MDANHQKHLFTISLVMLILLEVPIYTRVINNLTQWIIFNGWDKFEVEDIEDVDQWIEDNAIHELGMELCVKVEDARALIEELDRNE